jgi:hypothetical protein
MTMTAAMPLRALAIAVAAAAINIVMPVRSRGSMQPSFVLLRPR